MEKLIIDRIFVETWGLEKTAELILAAIGAATIVMIIGNHLIPNKPINIIEKEI